MWKASRAFMSMAREVQVSAAYSRTDWTRAWYIARVHYTDYSASRSKHSLSVASHTDINQMVNHQGIPGLYLSGVMV